MSNKVYDVLKWIVMIVLPALATFYVTLASLWGWGYTEQISGTITAIATVLGAVLMISSNNYKKNNK